MTRSGHAANYSFDHLVGAREQHWRHCEAKHPSGLEVDDKLVLRRRLHRLIGRFLALEDAIDVAGCVAIRVEIVRPIGPVWLPYTWLADISVIYHTLAIRSLGELVSFFERRVRHIPTCLIHQVIFATLAGQNRHPDGSRERPPRAFRTSTASG